MARLFTSVLVTVLAYGIWGGGNASAQLVNVAVGKSTTQSSTLNGDTVSFGGAKVVDGNFASINHTDFDDFSPYWEVDLGLEFDIETVNLYNRTDCCGNRFYNVTVEILDASDSPVYTSDVFNPWDGTGSVPADPGGGPFIVDLTGEPGGNVSGQTVRVSKSGFAGNENEYWMALREVEVMSPISSLPKINLQVDRETGAMTLVNFSGTDCAHSRLQHPI